MMIRVGWYIEKEQLVRALATEGLALIQDEYGYKIVKIPDWLKPEEPRNESQLD